MKRLLVYVFLFLVFSSGKTYAFSKEISIIFSGEELGNLQPCGCYEGQLGGISRRYSFIDFFRKQKNQVFSVSLGDLPKGCGRQDEMKMEILCRAMGFMGYILHNLGEKDIEISPQILGFLSQSQGIDFLSTNVSIDAPFPVRINQFVVKECFDLDFPVKIAFLGILSKTFLDPNVSENITISEPVKALKPFVKKLRNKVNLIVLLSHAPLEESKKIAKYFPEIGLIITGHNIDEPSEAITYIQNTPVVSPGIGGKFIGIAKYVVNNKTLERKSVDVVPLDHSYRESQEMVLLIQDYQHMLKEEDLLSKTPQAPLRKGLSYAGGLACNVCHKIIYDHWCKTAHGASYNTLLGTGNQYDPECIKCHTTGYGYISGFFNDAKNQGLVNVGCESCHGAGNKHIENVNDVYGSVNEATCLVCHDNEHSPKFQFDEYWKRIVHPNESLKTNPQNIKSQ
ncbi:MAG: multiheme c-type cytochrome [Candidatus Brocadiaceae bacterium]|nr:multiheme c-type cytochrome [Candidatus Brocadiaceae bacterium]